MDKKITVTINPDIFNQLRITSIHRQEDIEAVIESIVKKSIITAEKGQ